MTSDQPFKGAQRIDGLGEVLKLLKSSDSSFRSKIISQIEDRDPKLAAVLKRQIFQFEDIAKMEMRDVRTLLTQLNPKALSIALRGASPTIVQKILSNVSQRQSEDIQELLEHGPKMRKSEVEDVRNQICQLALRLQEEGKLVIHREQDQWV